MNDIRVAILAAGKGTRMGDIDIPKVLVALKGKPLLSYVLDTVKGLGLKTKPLVVVGYKHELIEKEFGDRVEYVLQEEQLGTAHAVLAAKDIITTEQVLILYGDMPFISSDSLKKLITAHELSGSGVSMLTTVVTDFEGKFSSLKNYGRIIRANYEEVVGIKEYKDANEREKGISEVNPGYYLVDTALLWKYLDQIKPDNNQKEYYLTDVIKLAVADGQEINTVLFPPEEALGINSPEDLQTAESRF